MISRAARLLQLLTDSGAFTTHDMGREMNASTEDIEAYISGALKMPLSKQMRLALLVIDQSPRFVRSGHALRAQVVAAKAYESQATSVHNEPPTKWTSNKRRH